MKKHPTSDPLTAKSVLHALRLLHNPQKLEGHPLTECAMVEDAIRLSGRTDSELERARTLREILPRAIRELQPSDGEPNAKEQRWRPFIILHGEYVAERHWELVFYDLRPDLQSAMPDARGSYIEDYTLPQRTYQAWRREAIDRLLDILRDWEEQALRRLVKEDTHATVPASQDSTLARLLLESLKTAVRFLPTGEVGLTSLARRLSVKREDAASCLDELVRQGLVQVRTRTIDSMTIWFYRISAKGIDSLTEHAVDGSR